MKMQLSFALSAVVLFSSTASAQYAASVESYTPGTAPSAGYTNMAAALGQPQRDTAYGSVTPFNPPFSQDDLVSIGEGGEITLRLSHYALPQAGPEIGLFANVGIADIAWPASQAGTTGAGNFGTFGVDSTEVSVSEDGTTWVSLGAGAFDLPTSGYTDVNATIAADFQQPFVGQLSDFEGLDLPSMLTMLDGSGGGTWLDISGTGLSQVGYVRLSLADDLNAATDLNFDLDAISIAHSALGTATVPEPSTIALALLASAGLFVGRRRS